MIILCTGMFRGGSTWSFNIAKSVIRDGNPNATIFSEYNECVKKVINDKIDEFDNIILKCHKVDTFGKSLIRHNCVKVIYTYRNPMECITSGIQVFDWKFDVALTAIKNSLEFLQFQKKFENVCLIPYEEIIENSLMTINKISKHLGINLDKEKLEKIDSDFQIKKIKEITDELSKENPNIIDVGFSYYDKENLFHRRHIRNKDTVGWEEFLSDEEKRKALETLEPYLDENGKIVI